jgi:membrane protein required for colicin V production
MALDIIGIALVLLFFIRGYMKGLVVAIFSLLAIILGIICSLKLSGTLATFLQKHGVSSGWVQIVSYIILFIAVFLLVRLLAKAVESALKVSALGWLNGLIGGLIYAFMMAFIWSSFLWLASQMNLIKPETIAASKTYPFFSKLAPWLFEKIGVIWPMVKNIFGDLQHSFGNVNSKLPVPNVDTAR